VLNELLTNAAKYGALSVPDGSVSLTWRMEGGELGQSMLACEWRERGGPPVDPPKRKGFGTELLEKTLAFELKGETTLAYDPAGLRCTIAIPLNRRVVHTPALGA